MYAIDSDVCVEMLRGRLKTFADDLSLSDPASFKIPSVVFGELYLNIEKMSQSGKDATKKRLVLERFLEPFEILPFDERCARAYARIRAQLELKGKTIGRNDLLVAATAVANQAILVTRNYREFKRVPELRVELWEEMLVSDEDLASARA